MDAERFDTLARSLRSAGFRRRALSGLLAGTLVLLSRTEADDAIAHNLKAKCKKKSGEAKKKCLKKAKQHAAEHASETPLALSPPPAGPTCSDNIKNGSESDVDCGGSCRRCTDGRICLDRDDCASAHCVLTGPNGLKRCQTCKSGSGANLCNSDREGNPCHCDTTVSGQTVCNPSVQEETVGDCDDCPEGTNCIDLTPNDGAFECFRPCAA